MTLRFLYGWGSRSGANGSVPLLATCRFQSPSLPGSRFNITSCGAGAGGFAAGRGGGPGGFFFGATPNVGGGGLWFLRGGEMPFWRLFSCPPKFQLLNA